MSNLTWTCHVCDEERPDARISVARHDDSARHDLPEGTWIENVRFCNDRTSCTAAAILHPDPPAPFFPRAS